MRRLTSRLVTASSALTSSSARASSALVVGALAVAVALVACDAPTGARPPLHPAAAAGPTAAASTPAASAPASDLGALAFEVTGSPACRRSFAEGMLALHSFEYARAHESFDAALTSDPGCAMAAWGDAMTYDHPIWHAHDDAKGRAALARVGSEERLTAKERAWIRTARALYATADWKTSRDAWLTAATSLRAEYPDDDEIALHHALATLSKYGYDAEHVREQMDAGATALAVLARQPRHPGAAHYAIHAFDSPDHAMLALPAARIYAQIAPAAGHALHMPSHTFVHLGLWRDVVPSNERAYASSVAWEDTHGKNADDWDWHSYLWLVAARLELGQPAAARSLIDAALATNAKLGPTSAGLRGSLPPMLLAWATYTGSWADAAALVAPVFGPSTNEGNGTMACAMHAPGGAGGTRPPYVLFARSSATRLGFQAALARKDRAGALAQLAERTKIEEQIMGTWKPVLSPRFEAELRAAREADAALLEATLSGTAATRAAAEAALEKVAAKETVAGPAFGRTAREQLADLELAAGRPKEALALFEKELGRRTNRSYSMLGAARAAKAAGDDVTARAHYARLAEQWRDAEPDAPALAEVRDGARRSVAGQ